jgi:hypothetical protein
VNAEGPGRWRCPECDRSNSPRDRFCGGCGYDDEETEPQDRDAYPRQADLRVEMEGGTARRVLKQLLGVWAVGYPIISILPLLSTGTGTTGATAVGGLASLIVASALFGPWIIGIIILGILVLVSPSPTPVIRHGPVPQRPDLLHGTPIWKRMDDRDGGPKNWNPESHQWEPATERPSLFTRLSRIGYVGPPDDDNDG